MHTVANQKNQLIRQIMVEEDFNFRSQRLILEMAYRKFIVEKLTISQDNNQVGVVETPKSCINRSKLSKET